MSSVTNTTQYSIDHTITQTANGDYDVLSFNLTAPAWTDATVSAFVQGLEALPLPPGCTSQVTVFKSSQASTAYTTTTGNPITFT